jgi:uncharacterized protein (DUF1800 family)
MRTTRRTASALASILSLALAAPLPAAHRSEADDTARIVHALNRLGYGPRPGDVEKVREVGLDKWIEQQLHPERIDDPAPDKALADLSTLSLTPKQLVDKYELPPALKQEIQKKRAEMEGASEQEMNRARREFMQEHGLKMDGGPRKVIVEAQTAKLVRAITSERQLNEVMVDFWMNHFNVYAEKGPVKYLLTQYERDTIRPHAWGKFEDLLRATAESPAMLFYLDNWESVSPNAAAPDGARPRRNQQQQRRRPARGGEGDNEMMAQAARPPRAPKGLNENYGREIMELHTLGVDGGYTQKDVTEVARCLTGWSIVNPRAESMDRVKAGRKNNADGRGGRYTERARERLEDRLGQEPAFEYHASAHDNGDKVVLGKAIKSNGRDEGLEIIHMLATHPATAHFISYKLARRFVADEPPKALVDRATAVFKKTDGDIREVVKTIITAPEFFAAETRTAKVKTPLEFVVSAVRASGAQVDDGRALNRYLEQMGMPLYMQQPPTGYKDVAEGWVSPGGLTTRLNFALDLAGGRIPGVHVDAKKLAPRAADVESFMADAAETLLPNGVTDTTRQVVADSASGLDAPKIAGLLIGSPDFQRR